MLAAVVVVWIRRALVLPALGEPGAVEMVEKPTEVILPVRPTQVAVAVAVGEIRESLTAQQAVLAS
jgi:hypothetical protein